MWRGALSWARMVNRCYDIGPSRMRLSFDAWGRLRAGLNFRFVDIAPIVGRSLALIVALGNSERRSGSYLLKRVMVFFLGGWASVRRLVPILSGL